MCPPLHRVEQFFIELENAPSVCHIHTRPQAPVLSYKFSRVKINIKRTIS